jgi:hypothetical protein
MKTFFKNRLQTAAGLLLWSLTFIVYLKTGAPTVGFIDSGELATVACTLGIAHPTGYPLFTLLGRIFSMIPFPVAEIVKLNAMAALFTSLGTVAFFFVLLELLEKEKNELQKIFASAFAAFSLAFSQTYWGQGVDVEVYSLHILLITLVILFFLKAVREERTVWWYLFAYTLGLSFTNHLTTILLAPAFLFVFFFEYRFTRIAADRITKVVLPFLLGLSVYCYLPVRSAAEPILNWGNPQTFEKFWWHVTGKQFRVWMFSSTDSAKKQFEYFLQHTPVEFYYIALLVSLIGFGTLLWHDKKKFIFVLLLLLSCVGYSINYDIHDIDSYFLLAFMSLMMFAAFGALTLIQSMNMKIAASIFLGIIVFQLYKNWETVDQSKNYIVEDYTKTMLRNLPENAIIVSYQWDYFVSASYYFQYVEKYRTDVTVLDKELFRRSWYFNQLTTSHPDVARRSHGEIQRFLEELYKFEHGMPYEFSVIEGRYTSLLESLFTKDGKDRLCFVTSEIEQNYTKGFKRVPYGLAQLLTHDTTYIPSPLFQGGFRPIGAGDNYSEQIKKLSASILMQRSFYETYFGHSEESKKYQENAKKILHSNSLSVSNF